jgi:hypothetical protein
MRVEIGLAVLWGAAGIAAVAIVADIVRQLFAIRRYKLLAGDAAVLVASRLDAIDAQTIQAMSEQEQLEGEFVEDIEAWLAARQTYEAGS